MTTSLPSMSGGKTIRVDMNRSAFEVDITRQGPWGNPFRVTEYGRGGAIASFKRWVSKNPDYVAAVRQELRGKVLGCTCRMGIPCHGDVLVEIADGSEGS